MRLEEKALFGRPIETKFGRFKPMSVYDYLEEAHLLQAVSFNKKRVLHELRLSYPKEHQDSKEMTALLEQLNKELSLKQVIITVMPPYMEAYVAVLSSCLVLDKNQIKEDSDVSEKEQRMQNAFSILQELSDDEFDELRAILLEINSQGEQDAFLNPEIQRGKDRGIKFHSNKDTEAPDPSTMITSIVAYTGIDFHTVVNWNITQLQHMFQRIGKLQAYQTYITFATVAGDKIDSVNWAENIKTESDSSTSDSFAVEYKAFTQELDNKLS